MKRVAAIILILIPFLSASAGKPDAGRVSMPSFTWDLKFGFSATGTYMNHAEADGHTLKKYSQDTQVGHFFSINGHYNSRLYYIKTGIGINKNKSTFYIDLNSWDENSERKNELGITTSAFNLSIPLQTEIHIVNNEPYSMSLFTGPKIRVPFVDDASSTILGTNDSDISESLAELNWGWTIGLTVRTGSTLIEFEYEIGISNISKGFTGTYNGVNTDGMRLDRHVNILSFSYGIVF